MEPNKNFSEEMQEMYRNILLQQHTAAYVQMLAAFTKATTAANLTSTPTTPVSFSLDSDIPKEEIECDIEIILVKSLRESLKKLETNLNGLHGKKFGFREVVEMANSRPAFPQSPNTSLVKRTRTLSFGSPSLDFMPPTPPTPLNEGNESKKAKLDDSNASSHDRSLRIDWEEPATPDSDSPSSSKQAEKISVKKENTKTPSTSTKDDENEYKPAKLRVERLKNIQKKKPKFNVDNLDLTYHSNMARNFPGSEFRSLDQQVRRNRNTLAARISRTKNKAYEDMLHKKSIGATGNNITKKRRIACLRVYANELMKLGGFPDANFSQMWEGNIKDILID
jgi:hypothetical protein